MTIPTYEKLMIPILNIMSDGAVRRRPEIKAAIEDQFELTDEERNTTVPSGGSLIKYRCGWAITYLRKAKYLEIPSRGNIRITDSGRNVATSGITNITKDTLAEMSPPFNAWMEECRESIRQRRIERRNGIESVTIDSPDTPEEMIASALGSIREAVVSDLLDQVRACSPRFFEKLVVDVLKAMGYGGGFEDSASVTQFGSDGGIDGIIKEDKLGLDMVYVQAKRHEANIGRPSLQAFVGAMQGEGVRKGVFVTTSSFSSGAKEYIKTIESRLVLVDGKKLAELMVDHNVGCSTIQTYNIKKLDSDYFEELD